MFGLLGRNPLPNGAVELGLVCFAVVAIAIAVALVRDPAALPLRLLAAPPVLLAVGLAILIGIRGAADPEAARFELQRFLAEGLLFLVGGVVIGRRRRDFDLWALLLAATAALAGLLVTVGLAVDPDRWSGGAPFALYTEATPRALARDTAAAVLAAAYVALTARDERLRLGGLTVVPLLFVAYAASGDGGPLLGLAAGLVTLLALTLGRAGRNVLLFGVVPVLVAVVPIARLVSVDGASRVLELLVGAKSAQARVDEWSAAWHAFARNPLDGIGTGGAAAQDVFLDAAAELGVVGLLLVAAFVVSLAVALVRARGTTERPRLALASALAVAAVLDAAVAGGLGTSPYLWLAAGLAIGLGGELPLPVRRLIPRRRRALPLDTTRLRDGLHDLRALGADRAGRVELSRPVRGRRVASARREIVVREPAEGAWVRGVVELAARAPDDVPIVFEVSRDGAVWEPLPRDAWDTATAPDGEWLLRAAGADGSGASAAVHVGVDNTPPAARIEALEAPGLSLVRIAVEADDAGSGVVAVRFQGSYDGVAWDELASATEPPYEIDLQRAGLVEPYFVRCVARDRAGNEAATSPARVSPTAAPEPGEAVAGPIPIERATLRDLERLVAGRPNDARREEQEALLYSLRPYANADGTIPSQFWDLARERFGDLVA